MAQNPPRSGKLEKYLGDQYAQALQKTGNPYQMISGTSSEVLLQNLNLMSFANQVNIQVRQLRQQKRRASHA
jgi:hypothetical protein